MSVAGGLHNAFDIAADAGCDCVQVFVKNQRQWAARRLTDEDLIAWRAAALRTEIAPVVAHATYLINLASPDDALWRRSIDAYVIELERCAALGIGGLVVHPGAHLGAGEVTGCRRVSDALRLILDRTSDLQLAHLHGSNRSEGRSSNGRPTLPGTFGPPQIWLEVTAGQGSCLGHRFEHLRDMIDVAGADQRIGVCFDTCHALAAGYRFDTPERFAETFGAFDRILGLHRLGCFHLNDSQREAGSRVDRHTHVGRGHVGRAAFRLIVNDARFRSLPMILETPKGEDPRGRDYDRLNLAALRRMLARPKAR
ncbi:MAG: deoxyribonuclease IV [Phycisphaerae bacterium]|nr:deoxyribonuclease IV [Phycisphaerae bacterium]NUQ47838.1 deoxyribonuclease IV [Phycisphaerae bacterium]